MVHSQHASTIMTYFNRLLVVTFFFSPLLPCALCLEAAGGRRRSHMFWADVDAMYLGFVAKAKVSSCIHDGLLERRVHVYLLCRHAVWAHIKAFILWNLYRSVALKAVRSCFITTRCKVVRLWESAGPASSMIKYGSFTVFKVWRCGERGQWKPGKRWLKFHLCVCHASGQSSHNWMTGYDWNRGCDVLRYLSVQCCNRDGHQQDHCYVINGSWDPEILSLFDQNSQVTCLNTSLFIFLPF